MVANPLRRCLSEPLLALSLSLATIGIVHSEEQISARPSFSKSSSLTEALFGPDNAWDKTYNDFQKFKDENGIPISIGAQHWFHYDRDQPILGDGYGGDTLDGTYFYFLRFDPSIQLDSGPFGEVGAVVEGRIRDGSDKFRAFVANTYWTYEAYLYGVTDYGTFKAGQVVTQFGLPWDGTWWEGIPYFNGYAFDPDYGVSWERTWKVSEQLSIATAAQFFLISDDVNGSLVGADAESVPGFDEKNTLVLRAAPTYTIDKNVVLTWGVSALWGQLDDGPSDVGLDDQRYAIGTDITLSYRNFSIFTDHIAAFGAVNPVRYVSGGPSDRITSSRIGTSYQYGPVNFHFNYSFGRDHNPDGHQSIINPGFNVQLTDNVVLYAEYVRWDVTNSEGETSRFEDGFQFSFVWNY